MKFINANLWEISRSPLMKHLGAILSILHVINYFYWKKSSSFLSSGSKPLLCWEFFPNCGQLSVSNPSLIKLLFMMYLVLASLAFLSFISQRIIGFAWTCLLATSGIALFFYSMDSSLNSDVLGLLFFLNLGFLFVPNKVPFTRWSIIIFYLVTAYLELSPEWLSGVSLHDKLPLSYKALEWISALGIVAKMTFPFLLLSPIGQRLAFGVSFLVFYHLFNFYYFRDFTSITLIVLNLFYVLGYFVDRQIERESLYQSYAHPEPSKLWWPLAVFVYGFIQMPVFAHNHAAAIFHIEGPKKSYDCRLFLFAKYKNGLEQISDNLPNDISPQFKCHPLVAFNHSRGLCSALNEKGEFIGLSSSFMAKRISDSTFKVVFSTKNICDPTTQFRKTLED